MRYTIQTNADGRTYYSYDYANKNDAVEAMLKAWWDLSAAERADIRRNDYSAGNTVYMMVLGFVPTVGKYNIKDMITQNGIKDMVTLVDVVVGEGEWPCEECTVMEENGALMVYTDDGEYSIVPGDSDDWELCRSKMWLGGDPIRDAWEDGAGGIVGVDSD